MLVLVAILGGLVLAARRRGREVLPGTLVGVFLLYYGVFRFASDALRVNDERVGGLTGAQWMCLIMIPAGAWILVKVRPKLAVLAARAEKEAAAEAPDEVEVPDKVPPPDDRGDGTAGAEGTTVDAAPKDDGERLET